MKDITIIVPIHEYSEKEKPLLKNAIDSCKAKGTTVKCNILIVGPEAVCDAVKADFGTKKSLSLTYVTNTGKTDFCSQVNLGVTHAGEYFSIIELDDAYTETWFKNVVSHIESEDKDEKISVYLPLTIIVDAKQPKKQIGFINEAVLASSFSEKLGFIDKECLTDFMNFNLTGGVFKKEDFVNIGGLKPSIKLTFWYEYLLRATFNEQNIYVIPKVGYIHMVGRVGSLSNTLSKTMDEEEAEWWFETAQKEYFFKVDRETKYEG